MWFNVSGLSEYDIDVDNMLRQYSGQWAVHINEVDVLKVGSANYAGESWIDGCHGCDFSFLYRS